MTKAAGIVRDFYDALARGDVPAVLSLLDENIAWTEAEGFPVSYTHLTLPTN